MSDGQVRTDGEMLRAFIREGEGTAFETVVNRHGPMVLRVCHGILGDPHEAQDAAQAVFLVLARKASRLERDVNVAPWLHRVAHDLAVDTLRRRQSRRLREEESVRMNEPQPVEQEPLTEERIQLLHEQIGELPERYRAPIVMCYLDGQPPEDAAHALGLAPATLRKRLERGRDRLRSRLGRLGWIVPAGALTTLLSAEAGAAVLPASFASATAKAAGLAAAGKLAAGVGAGMISAHTAALTKGAANMLFWSSVKTAAVATAASVVVAGTGVVVAQRAADKAVEVTNTIASPPVEAVTTNSGIVITTMVPKTIWMEKETLKFTVRLQNITDSPIDLGKAGYSVLLTDSALRCSYSPHQEGTDFVGAFQSAVLKAKEAMEVSVDLSQRTGFRLTGAINTNLFDVVARPGTGPRDGKRHSMPKFLPTGHYDLRVVFNGPDRNRTDTKPGTWMPNLTYSSEGLPNVTPARIRIVARGESRD